MQHADTRCKSSGGGHCLSGLEWRGVCWETERELEGGICVQSDIICIDVTQLNFREY